MVHKKESFGDKDEPETAPGWMLALVYAPLLVAAVTVVGLIVTLHLMYDPWLVRYRQYSLYISGAVTIAAFVACCTIACFIRRKQMYGRSNCVTASTRLLDGKTYLPIYVGADTPSANISVLPLKFVVPPVNATKPAAG